MRKKYLLYVPLRLRKMRKHFRKKPFTSKCTKSDVSISHVFPHFRVHPVCEETLAPSLHSRGPGFFLGSLAIEIQGRRFIVLFCNSNLLKQEASNVVILQLVKIQFLFQNFPLCYLFCQKIAVHIAMGNNKPWSETNGFGT